MQVIITLDAVKVIARANSIKLLYGKYKSTNRISSH